MVNNQWSNLYVPPKTKSTMIIAVSDMSYVGASANIQFQILDYKPAVPSVTGMTPDDVFKKIQKSALKDSSGYE